MILFFFLIKSVRAWASVFVHNNHFSLFVVPEVCITCLLSSQKVCCFFPFCCCSSPISALAIHGRLFRHFGCLFPSSYPHTYHLHITLRSSFSPVERKERKQIQYSKGLRCFFVPLTEIKLKKWQLLFIVISVFFIFWYLYTSLLFGFFFWRVLCFFFYSASCSL